ncbi:PAX-interacting protein 1 [Portunus trituberculatus]|uniref:PAX-interacting protein 1 n=1 Tax=Portunus trituberculatus TaxID=210409 RepID=A0A5B7CGS2_PORTR|nr:PAX-interacting protein 1 [Portunus trituberculatus]
MTHLITGEDPNENDIGEVKDIYEKPVVNERWVILSVKCGKQLPWNGFSPDTTQIFSGVTACVSQLPYADTLSVWGMITYHGGQFSLQLNKSCTHLIVGKPDGAKYKCALENEEDITIVTPDWVPDCIEEGSRIDETEYHPRLLKLPKSLASQVPQPQSRPVREQKKRQTRKEEQKREEENQKIEEAKAKEALRKKEAEKKSLFDAIEFSDEEEDSKKGISLLDQLKSSQTWRQPSTKPTMTTRMSAAAATATTAVSQDKPKTPLTAPISAKVVTSPLPPSSLPPVTPQPTTTSKESVQTSSEGLAAQNSGQITGHLNSQPSTSGSSQSPPINKTLTDLTQHPQTTSSAIGPKIVEASATMPVTTPAQLVNQHPVANMPVSTQPDVPPVMMPQGVALRPVGPAPPHLVPPNTVRPNLQGASRAPHPNPVRAPLNPSRTTTPTPNRSTPPNTSRATPPISRATPPITTQAASVVASRGAPGAPTTPSRATPPANPRATPPISARTTPPTTCRATPPNRITPPVATRPGLPGVVGPGPRVPTMPLTMTGPTVRSPGAVSQVAPGAVPSPSMPSTMPNQQVHSVAIPGAVVRLPQGVTPQQLQMMTPNDRQTFLQKLHQKQQQEQQARGKPRLGKPPGPQYKQGIRYAPAGPNMHTPGTPPAPGTAVSTWPSGTPATPGLRPTMTSVAPGTVGVNYPANQMRAQGPGAPPVGTPSTPGEGVRPGWPGQGQPQYQGQHPPGTRLVVGQPGWQAQQQQQQQPQQQPPQQGGMRPQAPPAPNQQQSPHGGVHQGAVPPQAPQTPQASQTPMEVPAHVVQKPGMPQEAVQVPGGEAVLVYQRRALGNITGTVTNNLVRPSVPGTPAGVVPGHGYPRPPPPSHPAAPPPVMAPAAPHYPRPHLVGHDTSFMCKLSYENVSCRMFCNVPNYLK